MFHILRESLFVMFPSSHALSKPETGFSRKELPIAAFSVLNVKNQSRIIDLSRGRNDCEFDYRLRFHLLHSHKYFKVKFVSYIFVFPARGLHQRSVDFKIIYGFIWVFTEGVKLFIEKCSQYCSLRNQGTFLKIVLGTEV